MNEKLVMECLRMLQDRQRVYKERCATDLRNTGSYVAYSSAIDMLKYAINGEAEHLAQFDYFGEDK